MINRIELTVGDITDETTDAIVNAANTDLTLGSGVAGAIRKRGGYEIQEECYAHGPIELGGAALTSGGALPVKWVIHAAVMHLNGSPCDDSIRRATTNALSIAFHSKMDCIAFPALGAGHGGYSMEKSARLMLTETIKFLTTHEYPRLVRFVLFTKPAFDTFTEVFESKLKSRI